MIVSSAMSISAQTRAACSRNVTPASVSAAPRVVRARSWTPSSASSRNNRRLTMDFETPRRRAADDTPPASATATKVRRSSRSISSVPLTATQMGGLQGYHIDFSDDSFANSSSQRRFVCHQQIDFPAAQLSSLAPAEGSAAISRSDSQPKATSFSARSCQLLKSRT